MLTHNHVWHLHIDCDPPQYNRWARAPSTQHIIAARMRAIALMLENHGFTVEPLLESSQSLTVRHPNAHAVTLLLLKNQLPQGVTIETVV